MSTADPNPPAVIPADPPVVRRGLARSMLLLFDDDPIPTPASPPVAPRTKDVWAPEASPTYSLNTQFGAVAKLARATNDIGASELGTLVVGAAVGTGPGVVAYAASPITRGSLALVVWAFIDPVKGEGWIAVPLFGAAEITTTH